MLKQRVPLLSVLAVVLVLGACAFASRNSGGTYALPSGNPVISGTTITSTWANTTLSDIGTELTNSLDRQGRGSMSAALKLANGTVSAPALSFAAEPSTGCFRNAAGDFRCSVLGTAVWKMQSALNSSLVPLTVTGRTTSTDLTVTGTSTSLVIVSTAGTGLDATGFGFANGVGGTGGATNGVGVVGVGGGSAGTGGRFFGAAVAGTGLTSTGGAAGIGAELTGGAGGPGLVAYAGTTATAAVPQDAIRASNGYISLDGVTSPLTATVTSNRITAKNITQGWAAVRFDSGSTFSVTDSYGIASIVEQNLASCTNFNVRFNLNASFPNALSGQPAYAVVVGDTSPSPSAGTHKCRPFVTSKSSGFFLVQLVDSTTGLLCTKCGVGTDVALNSFDLTVIGAY